ncbi:SusF/SusE family outer membrane protein [Mucilaginibacter sp. UC70_90]
MKKTKKDIWCRMFQLRYPLGLFVAILMASACKKELKAPELQPLTTGTFSASTSKIVIDSSKPGDVAVVLSWNTYPNQLINYTLVFSSGNKQDSVQVPSNLVSETFSNSQFNTILLNGLGLTVGTEADVQVKLNATVPTKGKTATSNTINLKVTPAKVGPLYSKLWIVGDATPNGWNIDAPNQMFVDIFNPYIFHYYEVLNAGGFKIPTTTGNWGGDFYRPRTQDNPITDTIAVLTFGNTNPNDYNWKVSNAGPYKISLNILTNSIHVTPFTPYTALWMVGDATSAGWDIGNAVSMTPTTGNPYVFTYTGPLSAGAFKIGVAKDWGTDWFRPATDNQPLTNTNAPFLKNNSSVSDSNWHITEAGNYVVTLDQLREKITIVKQ